MALWLQSVPARKTNPGVVPPGLEPTIYGAGVTRVSGMRLPDEVVYLHSETTRSACHHAFIGRPAGSLRPTTHIDHVMGRSAAPCHPPPPPKELWRWCHGCFRYAPPPRLDSLSLPLPFTPN